jgi:hypothetical protein
MVFFRLISLLAFAFPAGVYFLTVVPTTYWEDTAAFQTAAYELGIVHNPSFPLYVLIGKVATLTSLLAPTLDPRLLVNLVSALFGALSIWVLYKIMVLLLTARLNRAGGLLPRVLAFVTAMGVAGIYGFWLQALRAEVYTLNILIVLLLIWLVLKYRFNEIDITRFVMMFGFLTGVGFANHSLIFLGVVIPLALMIGIAYSHRILNVGSMVLAGIFCFLALTVFLYLPIRELFAPVFNWGDFSSFDNFLDSILRLDSRTAVVLTGSTVPLIDRVLSVLGSFMTPGGLVAVVLAIAGIVYFWKYDAFLTIMLSAVLVFNILITGYAADFSPYNLDLFGYLMPTYAVLGVFSCLGLCGVVSWLSERFKVQLTGYRVGLALSAAIALVIVGLNFETTYAKASKSDVTIAERYAHDLLISLPRHAIFLAGEDNSFSPLLCEQVVGGIRPDVIVLSGGALLRHDYRRKTRERYPQLKYPDDWQESDFEIKFRKNLEAWIKANDRANPVYMTLSEWTSPLIPELRQAGLAYSYDPGYKIKSSDTEKARAQLLHFSDIAQQCNDLTSREHFGRLLYNHGVYLVGHNQIADAVEECRDAARTDPTNVPLLVNCLRVFTAARSAEDQQWVSDMIFAVDPNNDEVMKVLEASLALHQERQP